LTRRAAQARGKRRLRPGPFAPPHRRVRFLCRLDRDVDELLRRELAERAVVGRERVSTPDEKSRLLVAGDFVGTALRAYFHRSSDKGGKARP